MCLIAAAEENQKDHRRRHGEAPHRAQPEFSPNEFANAGNAVTGKGAALETAHDQGGDECDQQHERVRKNEQHGMKTVVTFQRQAYKSRSCRPAKDKYQDAEHKQPPSSPQFRPVVKYSFHVLGLLRCGVRCGVREPEDSGSIVPSAISFRMRHRDYALLFCNPSGLFLADHRIILVRFQIHAYPFSRHPGDRGAPR